MSLQNRAAAILDRTHTAPPVLDNVQIAKIRAVLAAWLDGKLIKRCSIPVGPRLIRTYCECLEMVANKLGA